MTTTALDPERGVRVDTRLKRAIRSRTLPKELVVVGPAGTGKTWGILRVLHRAAVEFPDLRILIFRQTRAALTESVLVTLEQEIFPDDDMQWLSAGITRRNRASYVYPSGSEIVLGGLDNPTRIASTSWDIAFGNEVIECEEDGWETVGSRLDRPGRDRRFGWLIGDTNPGDPSHWLKKRIDSGVTAAWDTTHHANRALSFKKAWTPAGLSYLERLGRLQGTRRKRYLEGVWAAGAGQWFETFEAAKHVTADAEYDPRLPVHLAVDYGVHTAAVWLQVRQVGGEPHVNVFGDYYHFQRPAYENAVAILARSRELCGGRVDRSVVDNASNASNPVGPTGLGEYERAGLKFTSYWPKYKGSVNDGLALIESFVSVDPPALTVHPRCGRMIEAFANYRRAKRAGQYIDRPEDEQNPYEDLMDALRGALQDRFPDGRAPAPRLNWTRAPGGRFR